MSKRETDRVRRGDIIHMKVPLLSGWKGLGVATEDEEPGGGVWFRKLSPPGYGSHCAAGRHEVSLIRWARKLRRDA